ncbi:hypothetical protein GCM10007924_32190 [Sneathiella chinensis]|uniref:PepSY domain-containing protein n=2 Tax=Sneathiella chinensis TaxID=349750 RepID=A0ABQ5U768_9PROT|nr:hypothetical protein GCM10007924_32190 [Sneathiella chinensis]
MKKVLLVTLVACGVSGMSTAYASDDKCSVPLSEWQPREALQQKLEKDGWTVKRIKTDDGCYEAYAIDEKGRRVEVYFNPKTFDMVKMKVED